MKFKHFVRITAFCLAVVCMLSFMSVFLRVNNPRDVMGIYSFYKEPKDSIDVALIGPSQIYTGFYSPLAYKNYGFTSYAYSTASMLSSMYIPAVKEVRRLQNPKLFVFEVWGFFECAENGYRETAVRRVIDNMPDDSPVKSEMIEQLVPAEERDTYKYPILKYHTQWVRLHKCLSLFKSKIQISRRGYSLTKNFSTITTKAHKNSFSEMNYLQFSDKALENLEELLKYCKDNNVPALFIRSPDFKKTEDKVSFAKAQALIESYGFKFLNMNHHKKEMQIEDFKDFYNYDHLNIYGMPKMTNYLSNYIVNNYDVKTVHTKQVTDEWNECAKYTDTVIDYCQKMIELKNARECYLPEEFSREPQAPVKKISNS